ncbi:MAG: sugar phosphate nucleotidyltransferase [Candidatus Omnitrophota bacterium]|nr:sugar phosphate nucleotidyltransferase [Candidatus Omnitrophota bacterium]
MYGTLKDIDVFILCGGIGKRLRKVSGGTPKPMVKIGDYVFLDLLIKYIAGFGFRRFILGTGYRAGIIKDYYSSGRFPGLDIRFSREERPLDTGGAVKNAKGLIKSNPFFVLNGDSLCKFNPRLFLKFHKKNRSPVSILLRQVASGKEYGEIEIDRSSRILNFREKNISAKKCLINAGVYIFDKKIFGMMPRQAKFSLERNFFPEMVSNRIFGYPVSGLFIDIGTPERYIKAKKIFLKGK